MDAITSTLQTLPPSSVSHGDFDVSETLYFRTTEEAETAKTEFLNRWRYGYDGSATVSPPNGDRPYATLHTHRFRSCD